MSIVMLADPMVLSVIEIVSGVLISYGLHDQRLTFTLTVQEARALIAEIIEQLTTPPPW
jgi:hypothetical protein